MKSQGQDRQKVASAIEGLLLRFDHLCADVSTIRELIEIASVPSKWIEAKNVFNAIRLKTLEAGRGNDSRAKSQYLFEEACAKSLYNLSQPLIPFDADSLDWVLPNALDFGRQVGVTEFGAGAEYLKQTSE